MFLHRPSFQNTPRNVEGHGSLAVAILHTCLGELLALGEISGSALCPQRMHGALPLVRGSEGEAPVAESFLFSLFF